MANELQSSGHQLHHADKRQNFNGKTYSHEGSTSPVDVNAGDRPNSPVATGGNLVDDVSENMASLLDYAKGSLELNRMSTGYLNRIIETVECEFENCSIEGLENALLDIHQELKHALVDSDRSFKRLEKIMFDLRSILIQLTRSRDYQEEDALSLPNPAACYNL
ncbi:uncharacterized protein [Antedon mediterranea]|uniref:uncharacterized protein n=1 Tax=Antedon mediterranea TaxID=105859 RepID=UPI003AF98BF1